MSAIITTIQAELKAAIEARALATPFALPLDLEVADIATNKPPRPRGNSEPMQVQISFKGAAELGRTSSKVLEQTLVNLNLIRRYPNNDQTTLDACHLVAEQMRDFLLSFQNAAKTARVEQLITPNPFDLTTANQTEFNHCLTLDMDVLRSVATVTAPDVTDSPILTNTRNAVWDAIEHWPPLADAWTRKYRTADDVEELSLQEPGSGDLPAIALTWGPTTPTWWTNIQQQWAQQLFITFWLPANWEAVAEWRLIQLMQAVYQCCPDNSTVPYVRRAVGRPPSKNSPVSLDLVSLGRAQQLKAWRGTIALVLTTNLDPNA